MNNNTYSPKRKPKRRISNPRQKSNTGIDVSKYINQGKEIAQPKPYQNTNTFEDFNLYSSLLKLIQQKGYKKPSEIQDKATEPILQKKDLIGIAGTGTGKTAAFLIPMIQNLLKERQDNYALIIAPTRELANQIQDEFRSLTYGMGLFSTCLIGGSSVRESLRNLKRKNHVIIGTPGRLQDMSNQRALDYSKFKVLILDEFDRMLDMGFSKEVQKINNSMRNKEQTLLFSATLDKSQQKLINEINPNPVIVKSERATQNSNAIDQKVIQTKGQDKFDILKDVLSAPYGSKTILFCETKRHADKIVKKLKTEQFTADAIHGNKSQRQRESTLERFKKGNIKILVATDVVARGIDVNDVELVINYQAPKNYADYVHRIGRTGRAGKMGRAITLID